MKENTESVLNKWKEENNFYIENIIICCFNYGITLTCSFKDLEINGISIEKKNNEYVIQMPRYISMTPLCFHLEVIKFKDQEVFEQLIIKELEDLEWLKAFFNSRATEK